MYAPKLQKYLQTGLIFTICLILWNPVPASSFSQNGSGDGTTQGEKTGGISMQAVSGTVVETMDSGGYTYVLVDEGNARTWVALPKSSLAVGNEITCQSGMVMNNFNSSSLNRTFRQIVFSSGITSFSQGTAQPTETPVVEEAPDLPKVKEAEDWGDFFDKTHPGK